MMLKPMEDDELLKQSPALEIDLADALIERDPLPEELALDEASRCKYLSKRCLRMRSTKAKGVLHNLCLHHRAKAILNQRRLELRKRGRGDDEQLVERKPRRNAKRQLEAGDREQAKRRKKTTASRRVYKPTTVMLPPIDVSDEEPARKKIKLEHHDVERGALSPRDVLDIEPFRTPAQLFPEDLEELSWLVGEVNTFECGVLVV